MHLFEGAFSFGATKKLFLLKTCPAFHSIFFVIANSVKQSAEDFCDRNTKKGCRFNRG